mgnify:CR=1 FL=1
MFRTSNYRELVRLFFLFVLPSIGSQLLSGVYIIVDGYFVGRGVGASGLAAIGLAFPFTVFVTAIGAGIGVGGGALMSISVGRGRGLCYVMRFRIDSRYLYSALRHSAFFICRVR